MVDDSTKAGGEQTLSGYVPLRLSTDEPVHGYIAKDYVVTGASVYSEALTAAPVDSSQLPNELLPPRASADVHDQPSGHKPPKNSRAVVIDYIIEACQLLELPIHQPISISERLVLMGAQSVLAEISKQIAYRLHAQGLSKTRVVVKKSPSKARRRGIAN